MKSRILAFIITGALFLCFIAYGETADPSAEPAIQATPSPVPDEHFLIPEDTSGIDSLDLSQCSVEELLRLRDMITEELLKQGYNPYFDIERNDKGEHVSMLQERLAELGYYTGRINGKYDTFTSQAMKQFEKANGLENDGNASREDQAVLYSDSVIVKATPTPRPTFNETESSDIPSINADEYGTLDYTAYFRNPETYKNQKVKLTGSVYQVMGSRTRGFTLLFRVGGNNVYISVSDPGYNIMENDSLVIYAHMLGTYTYESVLHQEITIPYAIADYVVLK